MWMGGGDFSAFSRNFDNNWAGNQVQVITRKQVSLPDWTQRPVRTPSTFTARFPLDVHYIHNGQDALMWQVEISKANRQGLHIADYIDYEKSTAATTGGTGCTTATGTYTLNASLDSMVTAPTLSLTATNAPLGSPIVLLVGTADPALQLAGLCTALHSRI